MKSCKSCIRWVSEETDRKSGECERCTGRLPISMANSGAKTYPVLGAPYAKLITKADHYCSEYICGRVESKGAQISKSCLNCRWSGDTDFYGTCYLFSCTNCMKEYRGDVKELENFRTKFENKLPHCTTNFISSGEQTKRFCVPADFICPWWVRQNA